MPHLLSGRTSFYQRSTPPRRDFLATFAQTLTPAWRTAGTGSPSTPFSHCRRPPNKLDFGVMALGLLPLNEITRLRVLVVHTNFAVGSAIARRLIDADVVALAHADAVLDGNQDPRRYDVTLLCPSLPEGQRDAVLEECLAAPDGTVIELLDSDEGSRVLLHRSGTSSPGAADAVAEALALPLEPAHA